MEWVGGLILLRASGCCLSISSEECQLAYRQIRRHVEWQIDKRQTNRQTERQTGIKTIRQKDN
jgi:hypothetical protein